MSTPTASPMEKIRPLLRTRQIREFTSEPVSEEDLVALAQVARWSGSSSNTQPWHFVVVRDEAVLRRIAEIAMPQTRSLRTAMAALAISFEKDPARAISHAYDEGRVSERILVAATMLDLGAGIAWIQEQFRPEILSLLGLGDDRYVRTIMAIGHPTDQARQPRTAPGEARKPLDQLVTWN